MPLSDPFNMSVSPRASPGMLYTPNGDIHLMLSLGRPPERSGCIAARSPEWDTSRPMATHTMCIHVQMYICLYQHITIYIYTYHVYWFGSEGGIQREREREKDGEYVIKKQSPTHLRHGTRLGFGLRLGSVTSECMVLSP